MSAAANIRAGRAYIEITAENSKLRRGLDEAESKLKSFASACTSIGRDMTGFGAVLTAPFALAAKTYAGFDDRMRMTAAVTGATGAAFDVLTKKAQLLGRETSFTAQQVADAMTALGRMGFSSGEIDNSIAAVLDLSRATGTDLAESADIAANSLRIFGLQTSDMSRVADIMTATANGSAQTLEDLFEALKMVGPQAKAAGENITETCAAIGILANMGIKGSLAGTALRKSFAQFAKEDIQKKLAEVGVKTVDANGNLRKTADIIAEVGRAMASMPSAKKLSFAQEIFDIRGSIAGLSLGGNIKQLQEFIARLQDIDGVAARTSQAMDAGLGGSFRLCQSAVEGAANAIGAAVNSTLQPMTDRFTASVNTLTKWIEANKGIVTAAAVAAAAITAAGAAVLAFGLTVKTFSSAIALSKGALIALSGAFSPLLKSIGLAVTAFRSFAAANAPALVSVSNLISAFHAPIDSRANQIAASFLLMGRAETALAAKQMLAAKFTAAATAMRHLNAATIAGTLSVKAHAAAEAISAAVTKAVAAARSMAAWATALFSASTLKATAAAGASAVANTVLAGTAKLVAAGFLAASGAATAFCALPIVAVVTILVGAFYALAAGMASASTYTARLTDDCTKYREANDKVRRSDELRMERLKQLSEKQNLTAAEMEEAARLSNILKAHYGDLGIDVDKLGGKVSFAADSQEKLNAAMREAAAAEVEAEMRELRNNIAELTKENESLGGAWVNIWNTITFRSDKSTEQIQSNAEKIDEAYEKIREAQQRLAALRNGEDYALTGGDADAALEQAVNSGGSTETGEEDMERAKERAAAIEKRIARENRTDLENRIDDIRELRDEYKALIKTMLGYEQSKSEKDTGRIAELQSKLDEADKTAEAREKKAREEEAAKNKAEADEIGKAFANAVLDVRRRREEADRDDRIDAIVKDDPNAGIGLLRQLVDEFAEQAAGYREQFANAMKEAMADGMVDDAESEKLENIREAYTTAEGMVDRYTSKLQSALEGADRAGKAAEGSPNGTFSAAALRAFGGTDFYKRTVTAAEQTVQTAKKILEKVRLIADSGNGEPTFV